jgi:hypothetical protein
VACHEGVALQNRNIPSRYIKNKIGYHLRNEILAHDGIVLEEEKWPKPKVIYCPKCQVVNPLENPRYSKCSYPLTAEAYNKMKDEEDSLKKQMAELKEMSQRMQRSIDFLSALYQNSTKENDGKLSIPAAKYLEIIQSSKIF